MFSKPAALLSLAIISVVGWAGASGQAPAGWQTYRSPGYGFTIAYPPEMHIYNSARGEGPEDYGPDCADTTIACFGYTGQDYKGTNFDGAGIAVNILREARTEQHQRCRRIAPRHRSRR